VDPIGWYIATTHQLLGHDKAAAVLGQPAGDKAACLLCQYERAPGDEQRRMRPAVEAAIGRPRP
jgi:hypothetical protein